MREQIVRLTKLTADLLDLSQLDAGAVAMKSNNVDLGSLAREVAREFGPRADRRGSRLELRTPDLPVIASADPDRVRQVIRILLDNALTHTPEGTKVTVTTYSVNRRAELTVSDDGPGIPRRVHSRIFERFYTADSAGGSGLGLAIARELAQRMEGRVAIASSKRFTAFTLDLPQARAGRRRAGSGVCSQGNGMTVTRSPRRGWTKRYAAGALALAALSLAGCGGSSGSDDSATQTATVTEAAPQVVVQTAEHGFDAAKVFREASPGVVTIRSVFRGGGGAAEGSGFVLDTGGRIVTNAHVVTDESSGSRKPAKEVFVEFPDRNIVPADDRRLRPLRRRRPAQGRAGRLRSAPAAARRRQRPRRRPAGGGDRQPLRRAAVALGRRRLGDRPLGRIADQVPDRGSDPDRRLDQPRQLRRPAARRRRPRARHQRADRDQLGLQLRRRLRRAGLGDQALGRPAGRERRSRIRLHRRRHPAALPAARRQARPRHRPRRPALRSRARTARPTRRASRAATSA